VHARRRRTINGTEQQAVLKAVCSTHVQTPDCLVHWSIAVAASRYAGQTRALFCRFRLETGHALRHQFRLTAFRGSLWRHCNNPDLYETLNLSGCGLRLRSERLWSARLESLHHNSQQNYRHHKWYVQFRPHVHHLLTIIQAGYSILLILIRLDMLLVYCVGGQKQGNGGSSRTYRPNSVSCSSPCVPSVAMADWLVPATAAACVHATCGGVEVSRSRVAEAAARGAPVHASARRRLCRGRLPPAADVPRRADGSDQAALTGGVLCTFRF